MAKIRNIGDADVLDQTVRITLIDNMASYFNRQTDKAQIDAKIKQTYGYGIRPVKDPNKAGGAVTETYAKGEFHDSVNIGSISKIASGFGSKVVGALATMFTEPGLKFDIVRPDDADTENGTKILQEYRRDGGFSTAIVRADRKSVQLGSSAVFLSFFANRMYYQSLTPADVTAHWAETIDDEGKPRAVNKKELDDATVIVIRLSQVDLTTWRFLAIFGASEIYPNGRHVTFDSGMKVPEIPKPRSNAIIEEFTMGGEIANPLSWYANRNPDIDVPEYPIAIIDGGVTESSDLMPYYDSLYLDCLEIDQASSHLLGTSQDAAVGTTAIERDERAMGAPLPPSLFGAVSLSEGMKIEHIAHDSNASRDGMLVLKDLAINLASGYKVPDYMVVSEDHTVDAASGIALEVKSKPLKKAREEREELNLRQVNRIFEIERFYLDLFAEADQGAINELLEAEQVWTSGELKLPENKKEKMERIGSGMDRGIFDQIGALMEWYDLATEDDAISLYKRMEERQQEFPPLVKKEKPTVGLKRAPVNGNG